MIGISSEKYIAKYIVINEALKKIREAKHIILGKINFIPLRLNLQTFSELIMIVARDQHI